MSSGSEIRPAKAEDDARPVPHHPPRRRFISLRHFNALAVVVVLAASGMVSVFDIGFVVLSVLYLYFLSATAFPPSSPTASAAPPVFDPGFYRILAVYVSGAGVVGLLLPIVYILDGVLADDKEGVGAAAPHLFLLAAQVFLEGVTFWRDFSLPMRAFVPILYNSKRLFSIADWIESEVGKAWDEHGSPRRLLAGRALAFANLTLWAFNLFGFLLPVYLPRALKSYYSSSDHDSGGKNGREATVKKIK